MSGVSVDLDYTDRPFVYDAKSGVRVPRHGFKGYGNGYEINDAWLAEEDMERYAITPAEVLQLKTCFDRINRRSKKESSAAAARSPMTKYWHEKRERLRATFNNRYLRLRQLAIRTRYRYNMRRYIITPPIRQCTHHYDTVLRRLCRLDGLSPEELQTKRVFLQRDKTWCSAQSSANKTRQAPARLTNASLQKFWKTLNDAELVNKSIKDQTQGGKSFLKQVVIPGKMLNCLYGKVLPDPTLRPDEIGIPGHVMEGAFQGADMNKVAAVVKRDPVFSSDAITTFTRVVRNPYPYITLPSEIITNKQLDFDGDNVSIMMVHSGKAYIETLMRLSAKITMYCFFSRTRLTFSQTNGFRIGGFLRHLGQVIERSAAAEVGEEKRLTEAYLGNTFAHCRLRVSPTSNVTQQLNETLLSLSQQYGPFVAYGFTMNVRALSFTGYNSGRVYPIGPDPKAMAMHIAESGSKGTREAVKRMFDMTVTKESRSVETLEYAKTFIEAKNLIRKQGHNAKKMDSAFQNIIVNHDDHLTIRVNNVSYDLGHMINFMQREWIMSDLTTRCLVEGVCEDESAFRRIAISPTPVFGPSRDGTTGATTTREELITNAPFANNGVEEAEDPRYYYWEDVIERALGYR